MSDRYSKLSRLLLMMTGDRFGLGVNGRADAPASEVVDAFVVDGTFHSFF